MYKTFCLVVTGC